MILALRGFRSCLLIMSICLCSCRLVPSEPNSSSDSNSSRYFPGGPGASFTGGGLEVGNCGTYYSHRHGFAVTFATQLHSSPHNDNYFRIDNSTVADRTSVSSLQFQTLNNPSGIHSLDELRVFAQTRHVGEQFLFIPTGNVVPGGSGIFSERRQGDQLRGEYYFFGAEDTILQFSMTAYEVADGIRWMAPIMRTFRYDGDPPIVDRFWLGREMAPAGESIPIMIRMRDEISGLAGGSVSFSFQFISADHRPASAQLFETFVTNEKQFQNEEQAYRFDISTRQFMPTGEYLLSYIRVTDLAGNATTISARTSSHTLFGLGPPNPWNIRRYFQGDPWALLGAVLPEDLQILTLHNDRGDAIPPEIHKLWTDRKRIIMNARPRDTFLNIYVQGTDNLSGLVGGRVEPNCDRVGPDNVADCYRVFSPQKLEPFPSEEPNTFVAHMKIDPFVPSGVYEVGDFSITDRAGNAVSSRSIPESNRFMQVDLTNPMPADITPPTLLDVRATPERLRPGQVATLHVSSIDDVSGMIGGAWSAEFEPLEAERSSSVVRSEGTIGPEHRVDLSRYRFEMRVGGFVKAGTYALRYLKLVDAAGNWKYHYGKRLSDEKPFEFLHLGQSLDSEIHSPRIATPHFRVLR